MTFKRIRYLKSLDEVREYIVKATVKDCTSIGITNLKTIKRIIKKDPIYGYLPMFSVEEDDTIVLNGFMVYKRES